jgi:hypothetical protein
MSGLNRDSDPIVSTSSEGYHCPNCDYDVRGLTESRCPECGEVFTKQQVEAYGELQWPPQKFYRTLILATIPWFLAYAFVAEIRGTIDRVDLTWLTMPFVVIQIHFALVMIADGSLHAKSSRGIKRFGAVLTIVLWFLILGHIAITVGTL